MKKRRKKREKKPKAAFAISPGYNWMLLQCRGKKINRVWRSVMHVIVASLSLPASLHSPPPPERSPVTRCPCCQLTSCPCRQPSLTEPRPQLPKHSSRASERSRLKVSIILITYRRAFGEALAYLLYIDLQYLLKRDFAAQGVR